MKDAKQQAIEIYGKEKVAEVEALMFITQDADILLSTLQSQGEDERAEIVEIMYFNKD